MILGELSVSFADAVELLLPSRCIICGSNTSGNSYESLSKSYKKIVSGRTDINERLSSLNVCSKCLLNIIRIEPIDRWNFCLSNPMNNDPYPNMPLYIGFSYDGIMRRMITNLKFRKKFELGFFLGLLLGKCLKEDGVNVDMIIPVPLHNRRFKERGYNQAELISYAVGRFIGKPVFTNILMREAYTSRQTELKDINDRIQNVKNAFAVSSEWDLSGLTILLIDDVATTGFTMHEAASVLMASGANKVLCCAAAGNRLIKNADRF